VDIPSLREQYRQLFLRHLDPPETGGLPSPKSAAARAAVRKKYPDLTSVDEARSLIRLPRFPGGKYRDASPWDIPLDYLEWTVKAVRSGEMQSWRIHDWVLENETQLRDLMAIVALLGSAPLAQYQAERCAELKKQPPDVGLSPSQAAAVEGAFNWFMDPTEPYFARLTGAAGYGKTYAVAALAYRLIQETQVSVNACALSFLAAGVLGAGLHHLGIPSYTIARTFGLRPDYGSRDEAYVVSQGTPEAILKVLGGAWSLLVIDEFSMVTDEIYHLLDVYREVTEELDLPHGRVLVVGDPQQLPPVGQDWPSIFGAVEPHWTLTDPMRYAPGSTLHQLEQTARNVPRSLYDFAAFEQMGDTTLLSLPDQRALVDCFCAEYTPDSENRILMPSGSDVTALNRAIRNRLAPGAPVIAEGDTLVCTATTSARWWVVEGDGQLSQCAPNRTAMFYSGLEYRILSVAWARNDHLGVEGHMVRLEGFKGANHDYIPEDAWFQVILAANEKAIDVADPGAVNYQEARRAREKSLKEQELELRRTLTEEDLSAAIQRLNKSYNEWRHSFVPCQYSYAYTVHKSQGKSLGTVYIARPSLFTGRQWWENMVYVAMTRAKYGVRMALA
jgi:hypothetical protein